MEEGRSLYRLLDASLNRAAEGLRVAEDVCRFHWSLPGLSRELRTLRHEVLEAGRSSDLVHRELLRARDAEGDVGRGAGPPEAVLAGAAAGGPPLPRAAFRNLERAREALRSCEEVVRHRDPALAARFEALRYRAYSLEKCLGSLADAPGRRQRLETARLCLLATQALCREPLEAAVEKALRGGADMVQLREKELPDRELLALARRLRELTARAGAVFIVNDRPDLARLSHADGLHLGQDDLPVAEARNAGGGDLLIGVSTHSVADALRAARDGADYIGVGPMFETRTKVTGPPLGPGGLREVLAETALPAFAIGGIHAGNLEQIIAAGARRVAVSSAILSSAFIEEATRELRERLDAAWGGA
jgi:thiamine-phosphate pyrophosphorylase